MEKYLEFHQTMTDLFKDHGGDLYGGEAITQEKHGLQCAQLAENESAPAYLIVSALLHDIGHLLHDQFEEAQARGEDRFHENLGSKFLAQWFGPQITDPIKLHVTSKKYLCATRPDYFATLSPASVHTLRIQGGPMSKEEVAAFEKHPGYKDAIRVRLWDDTGKDPDMQTRNLEHFLAYADRI